MGTAKNKDGCTIVIAHRLTTIKNCDKIIVMNNGTKVEEGLHEDLLKIKISHDASGAKCTGWYRDLWETQHGSDHKDVHSDLWIAHLEDKVKNLEKQLSEQAPLRRWPSR